MVGTGELYWRDKGVRDRLGFALENDKIYKDVDFVVGKGEVRFSAHKLILRLSSLVFENLITTLEEKGQKEIKLPHVNPNYFQRLLKFIYTDELEMYDLLQFLEVGTEFGFKKLPEQSIQVLKRSEITVENAVYMLEVAKGLGDHQLEQSSFLFILNNAKPILESKEFLRISKATLCQILLEDRLFADEITVFQAAVRWAKYQCEKSQVPEDDPENLRAVLKDARLYIRYTLMGYDQFLSEVKPSGILLSEEFLPILEYFVTPGQTILNIPTRARAFRAGANNDDDGLKNNGNDSSVCPALPPVPLPPEAKEDRVKEFRMENITLEWRDLLHSIQLRFSVSKIILSDVEIVNCGAGNERRIHLPNLELVHFYQKKDSGCRLPSRRFMSGINLKEFLFFDKEKLRKWSLSDLWSQRVDVHVDVKGVKLLEITPQSTKRLTLTYPQQEESEQILSSLRPSDELTSLCIHTCFLKQPGLLPLESIRTLVLNSVEFDNSLAATSLINGIPNLENFGIFIDYGLTIHFDYDLKQRNSLKRLAFAKVNFGTYRKRKQVVPFSALEELYLDVCCWPQSFVEQFAFFFPKLQRLAIRTKDHCRVNAQMFQDILGIKTLERVALFRYTGNDDTLKFPNLNIRLPPFSTCKRAVEKFLLSTGLRFDGTGADVPDFIIQKNPTTDIWSVVVTAVENQQRLFDEIHFKSSMLDVFFADEGVYKQARS